MEASVTAGPRAAWRHSPLPPARRTCRLRTPSRYGEAKTTPRPPFPADPSSASSAPPVSAGLEVPVSPRRTLSAAAYPGPKAAEGRCGPRPFPRAAATGPSRPMTAPHTQPRLERWAWSVSNFRAAVGNFRRPALREPGWCFTELWLVPVRR